MKVIEGDNANRFRVTFNPFISPIPYSLSSVEEESTEWCSNLTIEDFKKFHSIVIQVTSDIKYSDKDVDEPTFRLIHLIDRIKGISFQIIVLTYFWDLCHLFKKYSSGIFTSEEILKNTGLVFNNFKPTTEDVEFIEVFLSKLEERLKLLYRSSIQ